MNGSQPRNSHLKSNLPSKPAKESECPPADCKKSDIAALIWLLDCCAEFRSTGAAPRPHLPPLPPRPSCLSGRLAPRNCPDPGAAAVACEPAGATCAATSSAITFCTAVMGDAVAHSPCCRPRFTKNALSILPRMPPDRCSNNTDNAKTRSSDQRFFSRADTNHSAAFFMFGCTSFKYLPSMCRSARETPASKSSALVCRRAKLTIHECQHWACTNWRCPWKRRTTYQKITERRKRPSDRP